MLMPGLLNLLSAGNDLQFYTQVLEGSQHHTVGVGALVNVLPVQHTKDVGLASYGDSLTPAVLSPCHWPLASGQWPTFAWLF